MCCFRRRRHDSRSVGLEERDCATGILIKYSSRNFNRSGGEMVHPKTRWGELVEGMSDTQLAVMRGPDRDVFHSNVPR